MDHGERQGRQVQAYRSVRLLISIGSNSNDLGLDWRFATTGDGEDDSWWLIGEAVTSAGRYDGSVELGSLVERVLDIVLAVSCGSDESRRGKDMVGLGDE
jgi:hypothetical protein